MLPIAGKNSLEGAASKRKKNKTKQKMKLKIYVYKEQTHVKGQNDKL